MLPTARAAARERTIEPTSNLSGGQPGENTVPTALPQHRHLGETPILNSPLDARERKPFSGGEFALSRRRAFA